MTRIQQRLLSLSVLLVGLGLYSPIYKKIYRSYTEFSDRHEQPATANRNSPLGATLSLDGRESYELTDRGIRITNTKTGRQKEYRLPCKFPKLSWGTDIAYDSRRNLLAAVSFGGEGYFYRFDVKQRRWLDYRSLDNADLKSIAYDPIGDRYIAWGGGMLEEGYWGDDTNLIIVSAEGELLDYENIAPRMLGFERLQARARDSEPKMKLRAYGNDITLMAYPSNHFSAMENKPMAVWHYNLDSQIMRFVNCKYARYR